MTVRHTILQILRKIVKKRNYDIYPETYELQFKIYKDFANGVELYCNFDYESFRNKVLQYVTSMKLSQSYCHYKYCQTARESTLYTLCYAVMIRALLKNKIAEDEKKEIIKYIQQFQSPKDGFFYDKAILNDLFYNSDWWGARHLVCHVLPVLNILQSEPNYPFAVTKQYDSPAKISKWLAQLSHLGTSSDFDNQIMNIATLLQYARDHFNDSKAGNALEYLIAQICSKINSREGLWIPPKDQYTSQEISVKVQFAYHLYVILCNEGEKILYPEKLLKWVLSTQNKLGGFGISLNSSACEDIDSIYLLVKLYKMGLAEEKIYAALKRAFLWSFANWNSDGGFVFRRNEIFCYGHQNMTSIINESNLFATWFRLQSLAYLSQVLNIGDFDLSAYGKKCWLA